MWKHSVKYGKGKMFRPTIRTFFCQAKMSKPKWALMRILWCKNTEGSIKVQVINAMWIGYA